MIFDIKSDMFMHLKEYHLTYVGTYSEESKHGQMPPTSPHRTISSSNSNPANTSGPETRKQTRKDSSKLQHPAHNLEKRLTVKHLIIVGYPLFFADRTRLVQDQESSAGGDCCRERGPREILIPYCFLRPLRPCLTQENGDHG